jgi:hypothetical protein
MQEMNLIPLSEPDPTPTNSSTFLWLHNSRDISPIVAAKNGNALNIIRTVADEKVETIVENPDANAKRPPQKLSLQMCKPLG